MDFNQGFEFHFVDHLELAIGIRDGNLDPARGYPARPDPNGPDFTRPDKE